MTDAEEVQFKVFIDATDISGSQASALVIREYLSLV